MFSQLMRLDVCCLSSRCLTCPVLCGQFESQDVLVPWSADPPPASGSEEKTSQPEPEVISTTSDDEPLNYSAFTHTSDSDSSRSPRSRSVKSDMCRWHNDA